MRERQAAAFNMGEHDYKVRVKDKYNLLNHNVQLISVHMNLRRNDKKYMQMFLHRIYFFQIH